VFRVPGKERAKFVILKWKVVMAKEYLGKGD
jgi:hypothetical protein